MPNQIGVVTPEAVLLDFETAGVGSRTAARVIDSIIQGLVLFAAVMLLALLGDMGGPSWVGVVIAMFVIFGTIFGYPALFETFWSGKTPGKACFGIQVVTLEGGPISFRHAAIRSALGVVEIAASSGALAFLVVLLTRRNQRIGDVLAGTLVLRQRSGAHDPVAMRFVPVEGTEDFVATIDVSRLTAEEYQTVRSFLLRARDMTAVSRDEVATQLANQMVARLTLNPPASMTPMQLLVGVAAAYQRRFQSVNG